MENFKLVQIEGNYTQQVNLDPTTEFLCNKKENNVGKLSTDTPKKTSYFLT